MGLGGRVWIRPAQDRQSDDASHARLLLVKPDHDGLMAHSPADAIDVAMHDYEVCQKWLSYLSRGELIMFRQRQGRHIRERTVENAGLDLLDALEDMVAMLATPRWRLPISTPG